MLCGESILCFAPDPWDDIWRNRHQIMSLLASDNAVLYVEPRPYLRSVMAQVQHGAIGLSDLCSKSAHKVTEGLHVFSPPLYAPLCGRAPLKQLTDDLRRRALLRTMRELDMDQPILWLFRPDMADIPGRFGESFLIYHIVDEYTGYAGVDKAAASRVAAREQDLMAAADLVLVTSQSLLESKKGINPHTYWVPNAVDYDAFARAAIARVEPPELAGIPGPRVAYVGAINDKLDTALLLSIAQAVPEASLVLVGPERPTTYEMGQGLEALRATPNVHLLGRVSVDRVPPIMAACDVGLLPYKHNAWTEHIHPLKMFEYLACGLPVVSTDIPSVYQESQYLAIASDPEAFCVAVRQALAPQTPAQIAARQERASENTWRHRVEAISTLIERVRQSAR